MPGINGCFTRMDDKTVARLKKLCESERRSMSQMIAILVQEALDRRDGKNAAAA